MLILFDIDLTMITTGGSGMRAMEAAGKRLFGPEFSAAGISFAGRLDPLIIADLFRAAGQPVRPESHDRFVAEYHQRLVAELETSTAKRVLPGVLSLLASLDAARRQHPGLAIGLLTGNFEATGLMKLAACGIDPRYFEVRAWGSDSPNTPPARADLVPVAMDRYRERRGMAVPPERVVVIGDTEHDVRAAKAHGCRALAVGTGRTPTAELALTGCDRAVDDLSATDDILAWLLERSRATSAN